MEVNEFLAQYGVRPDELKHYGVKGMKWGTTKAPEVMPEIPAGVVDAAGGDVLPFDTIQEIKTPLGKLKVKQKGDLQLFLNNLWDRKVKVGPVTINRRGLVNRFLESIFTNKANPAKIKITTD